MDATTPSVTLTADREASLTTTLHVIYALHAVGLVLGAFGASTVVGSFLFGWPSIIAVILGYIKRGDATGTWLRTHFDWQIRTFWWALAWVVLVGVISGPLMLVVVGFFTWAMGMFVLGVWAVYRIARGWLRLKARQAMPV